MLQSFPSDRLTSLLGLAMSARMTGNGSDHGVLIPDLKASELHALYAVCMRFPFVKRYFRHQALLL